MFSLVVLLCGAFTSLPAAAAEPQPEPSNCFDVEVNGQHAPPSFNCLTQKLQPTAPPAQQNGTPGLASEAIVNRPSNQLGLFNRAATSNRMGNTFGTSVFPQRPPSQFGPAPMGSRP
jgi:hypothetical protein